MFLDIFFVLKKYTLEFCSIFFYILSSKNTRKLIFAVFFTFYPLKITRKIFVVSFMFLIIISLPNMISQDVGCEAAIHTFKTIFESNKKGTGAVTSVYRCIECLQHRSEAKTSGYRHDLFGRDKLDAL